MVVVARPQAAQGGQGQGHTALARSGAAAFVPQALLLVGAAACCCGGGRGCRHHNFAAFAGGRSGTLRRCRRRAPVRGVVIVGVVVALVMQPHGLTKAAWGWGGWVGGWVHKIAGGCSRACDRALKRTR